MRSQVCNSPPRSRILAHPGRLAPIRFHTMDGREGAHVRLLLQPGRTLFEGIVEPLAARDIHGASMTILGGFFDELQFCMAPPDPSGAAVIAYGAPVAAGPSYLVFGNATLGKGLKGEPLVHCHGAIRCQDGIVRGGHILTDRAVVRHPIPVLVTAFAGFDLRQSYDPETNITLLQPFSEPAHG